MAKRNPKITDKMADEIVIFYTDECKRLEDEKVPGRSLKDCVYMANSATRAKFGYGVRDLFISW